MEFGAASSIPEMDVNYVIIRYPLVSLLFLIIQNILLWVPVGLQGLIAFAYMLCNSWWHKTIHDKYKCQSSRRRRSRACNCRLLNVYVYFILDTLMLSTFVLLQSRWKVIDDYEFMIGIMACRILFYIALRYYNLMCFDTM